MKFNEFFQLCLEKCLVTNKANFRDFLEAYLSIAGEESQLSFKVFPNLLTIIAKKLVPGEKKPIYSLINQYLGDKTVAVENRSRALVYAQLRSPGSCCRTK
jgi:hypothetical protein